MSLCVDGADTSTAANMVTGDAKYRQMAENTIDQDDKTPYTTYFGVKVSDTDNSLRAGARGPTLLEGRLLILAAGL